MELRPLRASGLVVALGAHPDDIEIGAAGTLLTLAERHGTDRFLFVIFTGTAERAAEAERSAAALLGTHVDVRCAGLADGMLPYGQAAAAKEFLRDTTAGLHPDLVLTHHRADLHQDHGLVAALALQVFRRATIWEYEIPKYDGDLTAPNLYVPLSDEVAEAKLDHLDRHFPSQHGKPWYERGVFDGLLRIRGIEAGAAPGRAEAFIARKLVVS